MAIDTQALQTTFAPFKSAARDQAGRDQASTSNLLRQGSISSGMANELQRTSGENFRKALSTGFGQALQSTEQQRQFDSNTAMQQKQLDEQHDANTLSGIGGLIGIGGSVMDLIYGDVSLMGILSGKATAGGKGSGVDNILGTVAKAKSLYTGAEAALGLGATTGAAATASGLASGAAGAAGVNAAGAGAGGVGGAFGGATPAMTSSITGTGTATAGGAATTGTTAATTTSMTPAMTTAGTVAAGATFAAIAYKVYEGFKNHGEETAPDLGDWKGMYEGDAAAFDEARKLGYADWSDEDLQKLATEYWKGGTNEEGVTNTAWSGEMQWAAHEATTKYNQIMGTNIASTDIDAMETLIPETTSVEQGQWAYKTIQDYNMGEGYSGIFDDDYLRAVELLGTANPTYDNRMGGGEGGGVGAGSGGAGGGGGEGS